MKRTVFLSLLAFVSPLCAAPIDDAVDILQSKKYPEAAAALAALPADAGEHGYAAYLRGLSLHLAGKQDEAIAVAVAVPADSPWGLKARFLKAAALTKAKKHKEAEAIYAAEAARAFSPERRDALVKTLLDFADEAVNPVAAGEVTPPQPDWVKAASLCEKVLDMPITGELRADVLYKKATLLQKSGDNAAAHAAYNAWLLLFDPEWTLPFTGGKVPDRSGIKPAGRNREEARLHLTECLVALGRMSEARLCAKELVAVLAKPRAVQEGSPAQQWPGDAAWLYVQTFAPPSQNRQQQRTNQAPVQQLMNQQEADTPLLPPGQQGDAGSIGSPFQQFANAVPFPKLGADPAFVAADYLTELRAFLAAHASHKAAPDAAEAIARTLDGEGKDLEAIAAYTDFIEAKAFKFDANTEANRKPDAATGQAPAESLLKRQQTAAFRIGQLHNDKRRYAEAVAQWQQYITAYPNGQEWQQAQSGIVDAEFQSGLTAVAAGDEKKAREIFDAFLARYPLDARARQILFIYGQFHYAAAQQDRLEERALRNDQANEAKATRSGMLAVVSFQDAITVWSRLIGKYPNTEESSLALYNTALILSDELGQLDDGLAAFKRVTWGQWAGPAKQRVDLMSSKSLAVASERVFRLSETPAVRISVRNIEKVKVSRYPLDVEAFFRSRHRMDAIDLLDIDLIAPEKTWEVPVAGYARYRSLQQDIPVEFPKDQPGACIVRVEADDWQATTLVVRSDIDVLVESARREVLAFVMHGPDKKPVAAANVLVSDGGKIIATGQSGADGVFRARPEGIEKSGTVRVFVSTPQGMAGSFLSMEGMSVSTAPEKMSRVFFDRGTYHAGEVVRWHAIRRDVKDGTFPVSAPGEGWKWRAQLPDGRLLYEGPVTWTPMGLCNGVFTLPPSAFDGAYKVRVFNEKESLQANFNVDKNAPAPAFSIASKLERTKYLPGEVVKGHFIVRWANGLPAAGERIILILPDGRKESRTLDAQGMVALEFAAPKSGSFRFGLLFRDEKMQEAGQMYPEDGSNAAFLVLEREFELAFQKLPELVLAGESFDLKVLAKRYDEAGYSGAVKLTIARRNPAQPSHVLEGVPWISGFTNQPADTPVAEHALQTAANGEAAQAMTLPQAGTYVLKLSGKDKQGHDVTAETTLRAAGGDDDSKLRLLSAETSLIAGQPLKLRVQSGFAHPTALVTVHAQDFFSHQLIALKAGANALEIPVIAAHAPNFRVTVAAMDGRTVHLASRPFEVRSGLKVTLTAAGTEYTVATTDLSGKPVPATVVTSAWSPAVGLPFKSPARMVIPTRSTGLSLESSVSFSHTGISRRLDGEGFAVVANDQMLLCDIQRTEISFNRGNTLLVDTNSKFIGDNFFLAADTAKKRGVFVINTGLREMKQDALGIEVKILTQGVPDISWTEDGKRSSGVASSPPVFAPHDGTNTASPKGHRRAAEALELTWEFETGATGARKFDELNISDGLTIFAYAVDGSSLVAADALIVPSPAKLAVRAVLPDAVTPGQEFSVPLLVTNLSHATVENLTSQQLVNGETLIVVIGDLPAGETRVSWHHGMKAPDKPGESELHFACGGVEWRGTLNTRSLNITSVLPAGGLFAQGEYTLTLPSDEQTTTDADGKPLPAPITKKAIGFRLIKAADLASFPVAPLFLGESIDMSEPQNAASELLHLLSSLAGAPDKSKPALQWRLALLAAELAVTEREGGWTWENINISPGLLTTAFTWRALLDAKAAGVVVSDMMLKRTAAFVAGRYGGIGATDFERKAVVLQAMAAAGKADFSLLNPLYRTRETLTPVALARLCAAFIHAGRDDEAKELLTLLLKTGTAVKTAAGEDTLFWPGAKAVAGLNAPEEATAAALWCVARLNPAAPEARRIALWLLNSQACAPGGTTRCRGQVMQALAEYARALPKAAAEDTVEVLADGKPIGPIGPIWPMPKDGKLTIRVRGVSPAVVIAAVVRETPPDDPKTWEYPKIASRTYLHEGYRLGDTKLAAESTSPVAQAVYGQLVRVVVKIANHPDETWVSHGNFLQVDEEIPAGCLFVEGSLKHNADRVDRHGSRLRLRYGPGTMGNISYEVIALLPGVWTAQAAVLADPYDPSRCRRGTANTLTILPHGQASADVYAMNRAEHLELARLLFAQNKGAECLTHLDALAGGRMTQDEERDTARMRLWILAEKEEGDARAMIGAFELLTERHPRLIIPFEKLLRAGAAYRRLNEFERAATVLRAALDGAFLADSGLSVALEDAGDYAGSVQLQEKLWREFPDSRDVMDSLSGLAQSLSTKAPNADKIPVRRGQKKLEKNALLAHSRDLLQRYVTVYPADDMADDAAFSLVNVFFALKDYAGVVQTATAGAERYAAGTFAGSFRYMAALGHFWQGAFDQALAAAAPVANGESKDRDYARYVTAQVLHAQGKTADAIAWYEKVKAVYEDAAEAIAWFEDKRVGLPEVSVFKPGEAVKLTLDYRNIKEGAVQLYKVDLMKLYLREKSLSNITKINLAGIQPHAGQAFALGEGKDFGVKQKSLTFPVKDEGAYLAIVRGDHLFTSGLVLISPLKLEVKEDQGGSVRVNVTDAASGKALADAEVKALGSSSQEVQSGATDPRGVFEVGAISGTSTVIVKQGENRYAFHRGTVDMGFDPPQVPQTFGGGGTLFGQKPGKPKVLEKGEYLKNIDESNKALQEQQIQKWEGKRRSNAKGVEAREALMK